MNNSKKLAKEAYDLIDWKASTNSFIQGLSGIAGFPFTLIADGATIFTHYGDTLNKIRKMYGRSEIDKDSVSGIFMGMSKEILFDLVADKILGSIPLIGIYFNAICAKTMTWRLGIVFTMLSARGERINLTSVSNATKLVRLVFPQDDTFKFKEPSYESFEKLVVSVEGASTEEFNRKVSAALEVFGNSFEEYHEETTGTDNNTKKLVEEKNRNLKEDIYDAVIVEEYADKKTYSNSFFSTVAGVTFEGRQEYVKKCRLGQELELIRDKMNVHDRNAIAVYAGDNQVGYIKKEIAAKMAPKMDSGTKYRCFVENITGQEYNNYGINIKICEYK